MIGAVVISKTARAWLSLNTYSSSSFGEPWQRTRPSFDSTGPRARRWRKCRFGAERWSRVRGAADVQLRAVHLAHDVEDLVRLRAVADEVAEADDLLVFLAAHAVHHRAQRLDVRVQIADDERSHVAILARTLVGSSRSRRSTISGVVSASRMASVMSAMR